MLNKIKQFFCRHKHEEYSYIGGEGIIDPIGYKTVVTMCSKCGKIKEMHQLKHNGITYE